MIMAGTELDQKSLQQVRELIGRLDVLAKSGEDKRAIQELASSAVKIGIVDRKTCSKAKRGNMENCRMNMRTWLRRKKSWSCLFRNCFSY